MRSLRRFLFAILCLLPALAGCADGGRGGSSGFDVSAENAAIRVALERGRCVDFESLNICPAEARASANTPTAAPHVNTDLATATSIACFQAVPGGPCTYVVRFVAQGFAPGTTFQALWRLDAADTWVLGPDPTVGGSDPTSFSTTLALTATDGEPVQFAILAFDGAPPSSMEVGQLHQAEATYAFLTQELAVNVIPPPTPSPTQTPTPTATGTSIIATGTPTASGTPIATGTPGPNDCCQCESSCAAPVDGSCGTCTAVFGSACYGDGLCAVRTPTLTATASATRTPSDTPTSCTSCGYLYVSNEQGGTISVIDTATNRVTTTIPVGGDPNGIAASPTSPFVWVGGDSGVVSVLNTSTNTLVGSIAVGRQPFAVAFAPDGATAYVTDIGLNSISIVDVETGTIGPVPLAGGNQPAAIAAIPDGAFVYVVNTCGNGPCFPISRGTVSIIDTRSWTIAKTLSLGYRSNGIAMDPSGGFALVANQCGEDPQCGSEGTLSVIDIGTQTVVDEIHITGQFASQFVAITPDGQFAYVANTCGSSPAGCSPSDGSVSVVDLVTNSVVGPAIPVAGQPGGVAITPDGRTAYVAAQVSNSVVVIDTATNAVVGTIPVGRHPGFLAIAFAPTPSRSLSPTWTASPGPTFTPSCSPTGTPPLPTATPTPPLPTPTAQPTASSGVVGTGTVDSCTDATLNAALARGGLVTFNCGPEPVTIDVSTGSGTKTIAVDTLIDGGNVITISGGGSGGPVFIVHPGVAFTVQNLTIANNRDSGGAIANDGVLTVTHSTFANNGTTTCGGRVCRSSGGAITNVGALTVINSTFSGNRGDAINNSGTLSTVTNSTFSSNSEAINNSGTLTTVTDSTFSSNSEAINNSGTLTTVTDSTFSGNGRAINNSGTLTTVINSTFAGNSASAIFNGGVLTVTGTTFTGNSAELGGAINNSGTLTATDSTFAGNKSVAVCGHIFGRTFCRSGLGGAINNSGTLSVANSTLAGNSATHACLDTVCGGGLGGAIYNTGPSGTLTVLNSTFFDNSASDNGGAIGNTITCGNAGTDPCSATFTNTIVASSSSANNCAGPITDDGHNLDDGTSCGFNAANGSLSNTDPQLDPVAFRDNGGPTQTIALQAGSPAIDAGDDAICAAAPVNHLDQRGFTRPGTGHAHCSIGAYEFE